MINSNMRSSSTSYGGHKTTVPGRQNTDHWHWHWHALRVTVPVNSNVKNVNLLFHLPLSMIGGAAVKTDIVIDI